MESKNVELVAVQALLLGLELSARKSLETLNEVRAFIGMPPVEFDLQSGSLPDSPSGLTSLLARAKPTNEPSDTEGRKPWADAARKRVGDSAKQRWALVREAGIEAEANGHMPSNALVARAREIIENKQRKPSRRQKKETHQSKVHAVPPMTRGAGAA